MKYMLLIHQGDAPTPYTPDAWERLSKDEQMAISGAYGEISQTPGVTSGLQLRPPEAATTVRVQDGRTLITDGPFVTVKEALGGWLLFEATTSTPRSSSPRASRRLAWAVPWRCDRSQSTC